MYIKVDHSKFEPAADAVRSYAFRLENGMTRIERESVLSSIIWQGDDATEFLRQFWKLTDDDSTAKQMAKSLYSYANYLKACAAKYKKVQADAVNRANKLPK